MSLMMSRSRPKVDGAGVEVLLGHLGLVEVRSLADVTTSCVACHAVYRL